jgi:hypothetical protein
MVEKLASELHCFICHRPKLPTKKGSVSSQKCCCKSSHPSLSETAYDAAEI